MTVNSYKSFNAELILTFQMQPDLTGKLSVCLFCHLVVIIEAAPMQTAADMKYAATIIPIDLFLTVFQWKSNGFRAGRILVSAKSLQLQSAPQEVKRD